jgi:two-component system CheB/CheR fusion protein
MCQRRPGLAVENRRVDLISCRNALIYLVPDLQEEVGSTFHYAPNPGEFLLLGAAETGDKPSGLFRTIDRKTPRLQVGSCRQARGVVFHRVC